MFDEIENGNLIECATAIGEVIVSELRSIAATTGIISEIRGRSAMIAVELIKPSSREPNKEAVAALAKHCQRQRRIDLDGRDFRQCSAGRLA